MEAGQGPNWGCSAKGKNIISTEVQQGGWQSLNIGIIGSNTVCPMVLPNLPQLCVRLYNRMY
jgi:hypothetical protein